MTISPESYEVARISSTLSPVTSARAKLLGEVLESLAAARKLLRQFKSRVQASCNDLNAQIEDLVYEKFLEELEPGRLEHYPRYFRAILHRLEKLRTDPQQDLAKLERIEPWFGRYQARIEEGADYDLDLDAFRWLIEEYRVSVFAQHLGTDGKVSETRLAKAWDSVKQA